MPKLRDRKKLFAAALMIAFLATLISAYRIPEAGREAYETPGSACHFKEDVAKSKWMLRLELGETPPLHGPCPASNLFAALGAMLDADNFFLIAYSALNLSFFLFLAAIGWARPPFPWILTGALLALVMLSADLWENGYIRQWIDSSGTVFPARVFIATAVKWGAIAGASALLGFLYLRAPQRKARLVAVPAFAAAALLVAGLAGRCWHWLDWGSSYALVVFWLAILIHSVIVAVEQKPRGRDQV